MTAVINIQCYEMKNQLGRTCQLNHDRSINKNFGCRHSLMAEIWARREGELCKWQRQINPRFYDLLHLILGFSARMKGIETLFPDFSAYQKHKNERTKSPKRHFLLKFQSKNEYNWWEIIHDFHFRFECF